MGMIGGGKDAFIGPIHRIAANADGLIELVCGAFSVDKNKSIQSGRSLLIPEDRLYTSYEQMLQKESKLPEEVRMDFVSIVTPNFAHFEQAMACLENGFHVVVEKPITVTLQEARQLKKKRDETGLLICLTHTYSGYPMVKEAKQLLQKGALGNIRKIYVSYMQGWLSKLSEKDGNAQAAWRTDPKKAGKSGVMGDIGTHAAHLAEYISGLKITHLCAQLNTVVKGRGMDDDGCVLLKFENDVTGILIATQVAAGEENDLTIKIYGEKGGLEWKQQDPNTLLLKWLDKPAEIYRAGSGYLSLVAKNNCRTPGGHPEGYLEAFANIYKNFALTLSAKINKTELQYGSIDFPSVDDGIRGMAFIENVVKSNASDKKWIEHTI